MRLATMAGLHGIPRVGCRSASSFSRRLLNGEVDSKALYPFPSSSAEEKERVSAVVKSVEAVFSSGHSERDLLKGLLQAHTSAGGIPAEHGGIGASAAGQARIVECIGERGLSSMLSVFSNELGFKALLLAGSEEQKAKYLPALVDGSKTAAFCLTEESAGSDASGVRTTAVESEDGEWFTLQGTKQWVVNGSTADFFTVFAQTAVVKDGTKRNRLSAFFVERTAGVKTVRTHEVAGLDGVQCVEITFDNVRVPKSSLVGDAGRGYSLQLETLSSMQFKVAAGLVGGQKALLSVCTEHASTREQFRRKLRELPLIKQRLALMALRLYACESSLYLAASSQPEGGLWIESALVKVLTSQAAVDSGNDALHIVGSRGIETSAVSKYVRDVDAFRFVGGTQEIASLFFSLSGLETAGKELKSKSTSRIMLDRTKRTLGLNAPSEGAHPSLRSASRQLDSTVSQLGAAIENVLVKYGKKITDEQIAVLRVAEAFALVYSMAACISRASKSAFANTSSHQHESVLANTWCKHCVERLAPIIASLKNLYKTNDSNLGRVADHVAAVGSYIPTHPYDL
ncbi:Acyl-CoA dehydrogenase family member 9, mitochondrial-like [Diplonema papillatum]|nr:Acyl-CoA dehydrogenase family member 9, mitochondrial-like [Diplonema papillatum]